MPFIENIPCGLIYLCESSDIANGCRNWFHIPVPLSDVHLDVKVVNFTSEVTARW